MSETKSALTPSELATAISLLNEQPDLIVSARYVLGLLVKHTDECSDRWKILILTVICGFGALTLAFLGLIFAIIEHGKP